MSISAPPETPLQAELVSIWRDMLGVESVGIDDDFFDLGGHSLLAIRMLARVHEEIGVRIHLRRLAAEPTVRALAAAISSPPSDDTSSAGIA